MIKSTSSAAISARSTRQQLAVPKPVAPPCNSLIPTAAVTSVAASPAAVFCPSPRASVEAAANIDSSPRFSTPEEKSHELLTGSNRLLQKKNGRTDVAEKKRAEGRMNDEGSTKTTSSNDEAKVTFDCLGCLKEFKFR